MKPTVEDILFACDWAEGLEHTKELEGRTYRQNTWDCQTACCIWGAAVLRATGKPAKEGPPDEWGDTPEKKRACVAMYDWKATPAIIRNLITGKLQLTGADNCTGDTSQVWGDASNIRGDVSNISGDVTDIRGDVTSIQGDVSNLSGDVTDIRGDVSNISGDVSNIWGDVTKLSGDVTSIRGSVSNISGDVSNIKGDVFGLEGRIS